MTDISKDEWELITARIKQMPSHIVLSIGGDGPFNKEQILEHIEQKDRIGYMIAQMELAYLKALKNL
ncbi:MAG: hypothetical protein J4469_00935 [Candidatus Aenigmarchaeota archaeon]|nr:hypothetical protein [Candidatus Aenigmarchaeota archaeon]